MASEGTQENRQLRKNSQVFFFDLEELWGFAMEAFILSQSQVALSATKPHGAKVCARVIEVDFSESAQSSAVILPPFEEKATITGQYWVNGKQNPDQLRGR